MSQPAVNAGSLAGLPPQDLEAEQMMLGACLIDQQHSLDIANIQTDDFYKNSHRVIFDAMLRLKERREAVDLITVRAELESMPGGLENVSGIGGASYLALLVSMVPTAANFKYYERIVIDRARQRAIRGICHDGYGGAENLKDPDELVSELTRRLADLRRYETAQIVSHKDVILSTVKSVEKRFDSQGQMSGIPCGLRDIDFFLDGFQPEFYLVAGRPSMGKTAFAEALVKGMASYFYQREASKDPGRNPLDICAASDKIGFISMEMGEVALGLRSLSRAARIPLSKLRRADFGDNDFTRFANAAGREVAMPIWYVFGVTNVREIKHIADDMVNRLGCKAIVVDYIGLLSDNAKYGTREQEVSAHSRMFKNSVSENKVPYIVLSQLNRSLENRTEKRPQLSDLRESGGLEQDADVVMMVYRDEVYNCKCPKSVECHCGLRGKAEVIIAKGRNYGLTTVHLNFEGKYTEFSDAEQGRT